MHDWVKSGMKGEYLGGGIFKEYSSVKSLMISSNRKNLLWTSARSHTSYEVRRAKLHFLLFMAGYPEKAMCLLFQAVGRVAL